MDTSTASQNRRSRRSSVLLAASLETRAGDVPVKLRNLSAEGALVQGKNLPIEGSEVVFKRNELVERGQIVWVNGEHAGVAFKQPLEPEQVLRHVPSPRQKMQFDYRRPGLACRELTPEQQKMLNSWVCAPQAGLSGK